MTENYTYGEKLERLSLAKALSNANEEFYLPVWASAWNEISHLSSPIFGRTIVEDKWPFPETLFREGSSARKSPYKRLISFKRLRKATRAAQAEAVVRRAKRMVWMYLHMPADRMRSPTTLVRNAKLFIAMVECLAVDDAFQVSPNDTCPDGPAFFRNLTKKNFVRSVPVNLITRNGVFLLAAIPASMDDRLRFNVETYSAHSRQVRGKRNQANGRQWEAVTYNAVDDRNLSQLL